MTSSGIFHFAHGWLREVRHNPCLMSPISALMLVVFVLFSLVTVALRIPAVVLGILLAPVLQRTPFFIEFLYPTGLARWAHLFLIQISMKAKKTEGHSRTIEQRFEVVKGRVYIHVIPQFLDNLAYLVVCCPPPNEDSRKPIVAFIVDCGDASAALAHLASVRDNHYPNDTILLQSILCTHKHHDHTAGNRELIASDEFGAHIQQIVGGAVERVPHCNTPVANGDILKLPLVDGNDMNELIQVEVVAVPSHTRGSVVYTLRSKSSGDASYLFTGDTMFSGGAGVPFEADIESKRDQSSSRKDATSDVKASAASRSVERCFAEILYRGRPTDVGHGADYRSRMLIFPGHEYTSDLLSRQFLPKAGESSHWNRMPPSVFFETASQLYITSHRRTLPHNGKLLTVPTPMSREMNINPNLRTMKRRAEHVVRAVRLWHRHFARGAITIQTTNNESSSSNGYTNDNANGLGKTPATASQWNVNTEDIARPIFSTVFAADLESLIDDLRTNQINSDTVAERLVAMKCKLDEPVVRRRPIPATLPTEKNMFQGVLALAMLGSAPCAMTLSDSRLMNLPAPVFSHSDRIQISKKRLLAVLSCLGFLSEESNTIDVIQMIHLLWNEAIEYGDDSEKSESEKKYNATDHEALTVDSDEIELGVLKWMLYGVEANRPTWFSKFCMPCGSKPSVTPSRAHPVHGSSMRRSGGELVGHDVLQCLLCRDAIGCPMVTDGGNDGYDAISSMRSKGGDDSYDESTNGYNDSPPGEIRSVNSREIPVPWDEDNDGVEFEVVDVNPPSLLNAAP